MQTDPHTKAILAAVTQAILDEIEAEGLTDDEADEIAIAMATGAHAAASAMDGSTSAAAKALRVLLNQLDVYGWPPRATHRAQL